MGKSTISMTIFNSKLFVYQRVYTSHIETWDVPAPASFFVRTPVRWNSETWLGDAKKGSFNEKISGKLIWRFPKMGGTPQIIHLNRIFQ